MSRFALKSVPVCGKYRNGEQISGSPGLGRGEDEEHRGGCGYKNAT
jgi:hypothetical protein